MVLVAGVAARPVPGTVDDLILAAPRRTGYRKALRAGTEGLDERERLRQAHEQGDWPPRVATLHRGQE